MEIQKILIADGTEEFPMALAERLRGEYHIRITTEGNQTLEVLRSYQPDVLVLHLMLPRMDGFTFTRALRDAKYTTPVLIITAKQTPADKQQGFRAGTDDYMVKPIDVNEMLWRVEALLRRSQMVSQRKATLGRTVFDLEASSATRG
jgi:DNA-binding response OmpR family regulator